MKVESKPDLKVKNNYKGWGTLTLANMPKDQRQDSYLCRCTGHLAALFFHGMKHTVVLFKGRSHF